MLKKLRYFLALADKLHFEQASTQVGADPSAFSRKIRELERDCGNVRLFDRTNQGTRGMTPAGTALEPFARIMVAKFDQAMTAIRQATPDRLGHFFVGVCDDVPMQSLAHLLARFKAKEPKIDIHLHDCHCDDLIQDLQSGALDVGLTLGVGAPEHAALTAHPLWESAAQIIVPNYHALATRDGVALKDITGERLLMGHRQCDCGWQAQTDHYLQSLEPKLPVKEAANITLLQALVNAGDGIGVVSAAQAERVHDAELALLPLQDQELKFQVFALQRKDDASPLVGRFMEIARKLI